MNTSPVHDQIRTQLLHDFQPVFIEVADDSGRHKGHHAAPSSGSSHFRIKMVSDTFKGMTLIKRHQAVYKSLDFFLKNGVHALQMELLSAGEWHARGAG